MRFARFASAALFLAIAALPACSLFNHDKNAPLIAAPNPPIADVPIPAGFTMTPDSTSKIVQGSGLRFVDHRYKGSDEVLPVTRFYREHMPEKGWTAVDQNQSRGDEFNLQYMKNNEVCTITISPGTFTTYIRVKIDPAGRDAQK